jgi:transcription initiation factor TFIIH subunit 3
MILLWGELTIDLHRWMKKEKESRTGLQTRILIIHASPDVTAQYIRIMNAIFAAQKLDIPIDVCMFYDTDSVFLQQASYMTRGIYSKVDGCDAFLCHLMVNYKFIKFISSTSEMVW